MTHLSLFSGIGGLDLAAEWAGMETVGQCEWADYPTKVLEKHWPDVPRWRDIRTLTKEAWHETTGRTTVDVISGGFPCQPFSVAGNRKGREDDRYLWPEMCRVIRALTPRWVVGENVPGILRIAARDVIEDLERAGYDVLVLDFEAAAVGAPHRRERIAFVARYHDGEPDGRQPRDTERGQAQGASAKPCGGGPDVADAAIQRWRARWPEQETRTGRPEPVGSGDNVRHVDQGRCTGDERRQHVHELANGGWWAAEPDVGRVAHGVPSRVDRLRCLGNAVAPQQFYPIFLAICREEEQNEQGTD